MSAVEISAVTKSSRTVTAVDRLSLSIPQGSVYGFIGPNGSGKSTTMRMIAKIIYPDSGSIRVFGHKGGATRSGEIGYLPEERGLYRKMRVRALLEFHGELRSGRNVTAEVDSWLERVGLARFAEQKLEALSKGMSQKVQFIAAVIPEPKLLILDEPFTGLDPVSADVLRDAVLEIRRRGCTVILSTHDMGTAETLCDSIFMIFRGRKVLDGTLASIQTSYGSDTIRVELEDQTRFAGDVLAGLPGIDQVKDMGKVQELRMAEGCDSQQVLHALAARASIHSFR
ncbi:MAG TPA: ATP-binding cassette domain-containing protein [Bryobacteraceae bacterium]